MGSKQLIGALGWVAFVTTMTMGARIRPGSDPAGDRVIWADPFDNYSQWAYDNQSNATYQPRGTLWGGGPMPAGSPTGTFPYRSDNGTESPDNGCGVARESLPSADYLARQQWVSNGCPASITTPAGYVVTDPADFLVLPDDFVEGSNCGSGGWVETTEMHGRVESIWQTVSGWHSPLSMFTHDLTPRIQNWAPLRAWDQANANAVNGTDEHPLTLIFYLNDSGSPGNPRSLTANSYIELNLNDEHAPTDYIWRGNRNMPYPGVECCPEGPFPIICQQVREVNVGNLEGATDLQYLNDHCPSLVPAYNPVTQTGKTWPAIAFGFLAITAKDPCTCEEQGVGSHNPNMNHPLLFDGHVWRELRSGRGSALTACPPSWGAGPPWAYLGPETTMQDSGGGASGNFSLGGGTHVVYLKLTTSKILIWMHNNNGDYCGAFNRVYQGPFNRVAWGVGPGCELQDKAAEGDSYTCKTNGTPTQCLTYSSGTKDGYWRTYADAMTLLDGALVYNTNLGSCCMPNGTCMEYQDQLVCTSAGGTFGGASSLCSQSTCCPHAPYVWADHDADGDVDMDDFAAFQKCYTGAGGGVPAGCTCFDRVSSNPGAIDVNDFTAFQNCVSGPSVPWIPANTPSCVP